ncbi:MAG: GNAT family N-acetyltransferase [Pseudoxanthomonas sp.]
MSPHPLDNPIWESLLSRHRSMAQRSGDVARYPPAIAPFLGVADPEAEIGPALESLLAPDEAVYLLGPRVGVPEGWRLQHLGQLAQMVCPARLAEVHGPEIIALSEIHRDDVLALTALVYPHYFRPRTMEMGRYFGVYEGARLAAMIGERMGTDQYTEISAVCTHPDFNGRGYARHLLAWLSNDLIERQRTPFLHVSHENLRAKQLYQRSGYHDRCDISFWSLRRKGSDA